ncbi:uncharacterized protein LOC128342576 [Hemicordylus capensis]|uniref:uncharacterized protein LOC128342576 n=1 Tax=Hemicordylus capensis TaxID=884348 RepID=UPI002302E746|nr:uncharacterized protein LOC128342576 [Hemicordylus capensis]
MSHREHTARPSGGAPPKQISRDVFKYVVTPDRIPEFTIPSLDILQEHQLLAKKRGPSWGLAPRSQEAPRDGWDPSPKKDGFRPVSLPCCSGVEMDAKLDADESPDPATWAALSLPHLPKITTPYGFVALGESPHVTKEEALFFQMDLTCPEDPSRKRYSDPQVSHPSRGGHKRVPVACMDIESRGPCGTSQKDHCDDTPQVPKANRPSLSHSRSSPLRDSNAHQLPKTPAAEEAGVLRKSSAPLATLCPRSNSSPEFPLRKPRRNLFQKILKKHFAHLRSLKAVQFPTH